MIVLAPLVVPAGPPTSSLLTGVKSPTAGGLAGLRRGVAAAFSVLSPAAR